MLDNGIDKLAPEIITKIRDQDTDGMCIFGTEKLGIPVRGISKLLNCPFYKDTIFFPYFFVVYIFGDRCGGQACRTGDIIDRNVHVKPPVLIHLQIIEYSHIIS